MLNKAIAVVVVLLLLGLGVKGYQIMNDDDSIDLVIPQNDPANKR